jgi:hypothetical protein
VTIALRLPDTAAVADVTAARDQVLTALATLTTLVGTPAQAAALTAARDQILTAISNNAGSLRSISSGP